MFLDIFRFEINYHRRQYLVYVLSAVFFVITFLATTTPNVSMVGGIGNVNINSPYAVIMTLTSLSIFVLFGAIAFCANAVIRDFEMNTAEIFLATPVTRFAYVYGRFFGTLVFAFALYLGGFLGVLVGEMMPWLDPERIGPMNLQAYWFASFYLTLPNIFICACIFFCLATLTRSMMMTYVGAVALLMLSFLVDAITDQGMLTLRSYIDPFGGAALEEITRYWTVFEKNGQVPALGDGHLLVNRAVWVGVALLFLAASYSLFPFSIDSVRKKPGRRATMEEDEAAAPVVSRLALPPAHQRFDGLTWFAQYLSQTRVEIRNIVRGVAFLVVLLLGVLMVLGNLAASLDQIFGTPVYPTTTMMVLIINGSFSFSLLVVLIYYAGELMVRERNSRVYEIMDSMPWPNYVVMAAKITGLIVVVVAMLLVAMLAAIGFQLFTGYYDIDLTVYLAGLLFFFQFPLYLMVVMALFFYVITRNKYATMFLIILYLMLTLALPDLGFEHYLYRLRQTNPMYSDFTGYAHNLEPYLWQTLYYFFFGWILLFCVHLLWPRGTDDSLASRLRVVKQRLTLPVKAGLVASILMTVATGGYIFYNTNILNDYQTSNERELRQADYEKRFKQFEHDPQPSIESVYADVSIYPEKREIMLSGHYRVENVFEEPMETFHLSVNPQVELVRFDFPGAVLKGGDEKLGYRIYRLDEPLGPGEQVTVAFEVAWRTPGFANDGHTVKITSNGTFVNNLDFFPLFGYRDDFELADNNDRREHGLDPIQRANKIDDVGARNRTAFGGTGRVAFEAVVSTSPDQIAMAPGYLQEEWTEGGRRYFHYKMDAPIWNFYSFMSADYQVKKDKWNDVSIEVYYLHDYNVDDMIHSVKDSLAYFSGKFSPYQYRQFRILEFPRFQGTFAQSFPNTIPFSEQIGFVADLRDPEHINYVYYVTAHELAHQWWAHQVLGADVQGSTMIVESLAQYSALMVMEKEYGRDHMKRFLEYELDRYLRDRGGELIEELPLYLVENQPYIHYRKGSVVLYALKDYIGEDRMNQALSNFVEEYAFEGPPYPTTIDLVNHIRRLAPSRYQATVTDLLERIVLYDVKVEDHEVVELDNGEYEVSVGVVARKFEANGEGQETEVPLDTWVDIGILGPERPDSKVPEVLYLEKYRLTDNNATFTVKVDKKPHAVGIDPLNKLIDRNPSDNVAEIDS